MERTAQREQKEEIEDVIEAALQQLRSNEGLYNRLLFFVHDLEKYGDSEEVRVRPLGDLELHLQTEGELSAFEVSRCHYDTFAGSLRKQYGEVLPERVLFHRRGG